MARRVTRAVDPAISDNGYARRPLAATVLTAPFGEEIISGSVVEAPRPNLLADRFKLTTHRDTKELAMYSLVVAKNGPKMKESPDVPVPTQSGRDTSHPQSLATIVRTVTAGGRVQITAQGETMLDFADHLTQQIGPSRER
jgi:uncharacterized protein (TIGR03435 family)